MKIRGSGVPVGRVVQFNKIRNIRDTSSDSKTIDSIFVLLFINEESFEGMKHERS